MKDVWMLEYTACSRPCWIADVTVQNAYGVTYSPIHARKYDTKEQAIEERRRLKLSGDWIAERRTVAG